MVPTVRGSEPAIRPGYYPHASAGGERQKAGTVFFGQHAGRLRKKRISATPRSGRGGNMLKKRYVKSRKVWKVTFELPQAELPEGVEVDSVHLVGEFNDWAHTARPMKRSKKGVFRAALELEPGREYAFRYLINGEHWHNDWQADAYVPTGLGADNCVVVTPKTDST
jgi:hypothetical protein